MHYCHLSINIGVVDYLLTDGGVNPPCYYYSQKHIDDALCAAGISPSTHRDQHTARLTPTPAVLSPPSPLSRELVNTVRGPAEPVEGRPTMGKLIMFSFHYYN